MSHARRILGGLAPERFLARHWQKEALRIAAAMPGFHGPFDLPALRRLAARDDVESRLVVREGSTWTLRHGPLRPADFRALPDRQWTLLVQGVNLHDVDCDALLRHFAFVPYARLDDVMVSYAVPGGGVGPHVDHYDVFLLQGFGRRRWRYGWQQDHAFRPGQALKILKRFTPMHDDVFGPGDLLYLPPLWAHDGIALEACTTYSIGFRAPTVQELAVAFCDFLRDEIHLPGRYADPGLRVATEPARIGNAMRRQVATKLKALRWDETTVGRFLGRTLSEPKAIVVFAPPAAPLTRAAFARRIARHGLRLDTCTQMLYDDASFYVNGESSPRTAGDAKLAQLANDRALSAAACARLAPDTLEQLHAWYTHGYLAAAG